MLTNWFDEIFTFQFDIVHIAGKLNEIPDSLSRVALSAMVDPELDLEKFQKLDLQNVELLEARNQLLNALHYRVFHPISLLYQGISPSYQLISPELEILINYLLIK